MAAGEVIRALTAHHEFSGRIVHVESESRRLPVFGTLEDPLPGELEAYLEHKSIRLYSHQCEAISRIRAGEDVIITTSTASGKSLAFNLPVFESLALDPNRTALYIYPTKALARDQLSAIHEIERYTGISVDAAVYDGDTPQGRKVSVRNHSRIILTNPYELHQVLPWHSKWRSFLSRLSYVVIDEAHRYRGVFGSHIAFVIRRLMRICRHYGSAPLCILSTATIANPVEFAAAMTGRQLRHIGVDGSPKPPCNFVLYNPFTEGTAGNSVHREAERLLVFCVEQGLQALCFTGSRKMAEMMARWSCEDLANRRSHLSRSIAAYRAGYLPEERREIERGIKQGKIKGIFSTNALELGVDIGTLDAVILSGFPGTMMSTHQQAGRAGRSGRESLAVLVASHNPLDQYFMNHPEMFFSRPHEHAIVNCDNQYILSGHLLCAAAELPVRPGQDHEFFGADICGFLGAMESDRLVRQAGAAWIYSGKGRAVDMVRLGSVSAETFRVTCRGRLLETMNRGQAFREAHPGAVLLHRGRTFRVRDLDSEQRIIRVMPEETDEHTQPVMETDVTVTGLLAECTHGTVKVSFGEVEVTERIRGYRVKRYDMTIGEAALDLPPLSFPTKSLWFTMPEDIIGEVAGKSLDVAGGLHGIEHALIAVMPFHVLCDRWDIGGVSNPACPDAGGAAIYLYDAYEGGIGLAEEAWRILPDLVTTALEMVRGCPCEGGCPACIHSPKCGSDNEPLDKEAAVIMLSGLSARLRDRRPEEYV